MINNKNEMFKQRKKNKDNNQTLEEQKTKII